MQIAELAEDGNDKIGFQIALLEDASLVAPCWHLISNHASADGAWTATLDQQIEIFKSSGDEHVRARTCDLEEIRDRVLHQLVKM